MFFFKIPRCEAQGFTFNPTEVSEDGVCVSYPSSELKRCVGEAPNLMIVDANAADENSNENRSLKQDSRTSAKDQEREKGLIFFAEKEYVGYKVSQIGAPKEDEKMRRQRKF